MTQSDYRSTHTAALWGQEEPVLQPLPSALTGDLFLLQVFCDMETSGGGWTIIQRRRSGLVPFYQDWKQYKQGFGSIRGDFWLGNEHIHRLTRQPTRLRVELEVSSGPGPGIDAGLLHVTAQASVADTPIYTL